VGPTFLFFSLGWLSLQGKLGLGILLAFAFAFAFA
jgi:hypothetical protein